MAAAADKTKKSADKDKAAPSRRPVLVIALIAVVAAAAAGGAVWYFTQAPHAADGSPATSAKPKAPPAPAQYFGLEPPFVVNLNGPVDGPRYLQVEVQLMTRDSSALEAIKTHSPALRARLLMLFSQVTPDQIADRAGKEKLQAASLAEVQKVLLAETGKKCADDLLFTSFVTQ
ncbi:MULTISPECIES: flagellar basal body-associated FliL family protein [Stenotrophomonas]|uniref:flagellar basal body-associated FliL family protein n=1 Tax=Stenotrophomonas TaxID=40323 RepID=UPI00285AA188|nr:MULTISPECIES: flagellar basal body-associated FliL family protein [Stenotrophomonas]MDR6094330.1 flagellar FliL protein [Stenotrophomonas sp. SORGH_AS_0321]